MLIMHAYVHPWCLSAPFHFLMWAYIYDPKNYNLQTQCSKPGGSGCNGKFSAAKKILVHLCAASGMVTLFCARRVVRGARNLHPRLCSWHMHELVHQFLVDMDGQRLGEEVGQIVGSLLPLDCELALSDPVSYPMISHVYAFRSFDFKRIIC